MVDPAMKKQSRIITLAALFSNMLLINSAAAVSLEYLYRGNPFVELEGISGLFSPTDRVNARFIIDCAAAHSEGNCSNLPYDDYYEMGAIDRSSLNFSAGPVVLPTADGGLEVRRFFLSTDYWGRIVDWDMDLFLNDLSLNVDTDNENGGLDSAAAPGESAVVSGQPGVWGKELSATESDFDITVDKTVDNPVPDSPQQVVEFTVSIQNKGPGSATDVVVLDKLPPELSIPEGMAAYTSAGYYDMDSGRWEVGDLDNSLPQVMTIPVMVTAETQPACIINSAAAEIPGDMDPSTNTSSVAIQLPDTAGCTDLIVEEIFLYQYDTPCEADFAVSFQIRVRNAGPDVATNVILDVEETLFNAPGLRIDSPNCDGLRCIWPTIGVGQAQTALGVSEHIGINGISDYFNVDEAEKWEIMAEIRSEQVDYDTQNNISTAQTQINPHVIAISCGTPTQGPGWDLSGVGGGGCFIATASYGSVWHPHVQILRDFRDTVLLKTALGRDFVELYYRYSPGLALYISEHETVRMICRWLLTPIVLAIAYPWPALLILIVLGILFYAALTRGRPVNVSM
jgi:uncharacterized repeat protein (TIGR01451 family)